jgi:GT2 family glycosyltransferase
MTPRVYVLAPVHNRRATTEKFIRSLLAQTHVDWHLVLIDDGSKDGTEAMARALVPESSLTVLRGTGNWWWAGSLQQGYRWLKSNGRPQDIVLTMNDDTEFDPGFLASAVRALKPHSLLLARLHNMKGECVEVGVCWDWKALLARGVMEGSEVNCFATRGLFMRVGDFLDLGGFHPVLLPHYLSDYEFSLRAHRRGYSLITSRDVSLRYDDNEALTGIRSTQGHTTLKRLRLNLSIRSTANPVYWTSFVLLASPLRYMPANVLRVWYRYLEPVRSDIYAFFAPLRRALAPVRMFLGRVKRKVKREWSARSGQTR